MPLDIACVILTKNEEMHIARCIRSVQAVCREVWVIDSFSTDNTCKLAEALGAHVVQHPFTYQAAQFNWAIDTLPIRNEWIWRVDADEVIEPALAELARRELPALPPEVTGIRVNKKIVFMGRPLLHGGWYPAPQIKLIRRGHGRSEDKLMDEHLVTLDGDTAYWDGDQTDWNLRPLDWWWQKHRDYAKREARNMLLMEQQRLGDEASEAEVKPSLWGNGAQRKRWMKRLYAHCPLFVRPVILFVTRYVLMLGFLDGYAGWYWHTRQGLCYRMLVDVELRRLRQEARKSSEEKSLQES